MEFFQISNSIFMLYVLNNFLMAYSKQSHITNQLKVLKE